jgi:S-adenosylmethionine hydrolase
MRIITFLSDFGLKDGYVGSVKGSILSINPSVKIVDISHEISPFDIRTGAYSILTYYNYFPKNTIHLAVVDPGVGSQRLPVIVKTANYYFVGPDNGLFSYIIQNEGYSAYAIQTKYLQQIKGIDFPVSHTFHGRDIFAPVAALLSKNIPLMQMADNITRNLESVPDLLEITDNRIITGVLTVDRFGNIITELRINTLDRLLKAEIDQVRFKDHIFRKLNDTYSAAQTGKPLVLWSSSGFLEIAVNQGRADEYFNLDRTRDKVEILLK